MKHALLALLLAAPAAASPYFRPIDLRHPQVGAGFLIAPKSPLDTEAVTDVAIITHSTRDGSIIPAAWQSFLPPESWVPLQLGLGGSLRGNATAEAGTSANLAPQLAALALRGVDQASSGFLAAVKTALTGSGQGSVRIGVSLAGQLVRDGVWQSPRAMFPGQGFAEIVGNSARLNVGAAWQF